MVFDSELDSDEEDIAADILELSMQGVEPLTHGKSTQSEGSTDLSDLLSILPGTIASLKDAGMYEDWLHYVCMVSENTFPLKNIAHLLFLDVCRWYHLGNTVHIRYSPAIKQFCLLCYKIFHGKFQRFMSGFRHIG